MFILHDALYRLFASTSDASLQNISKPQFLLNWTFLLRFYLVIVI